MQTISHRESPKDLIAKVNDNFRELSEAPEPEVYKPIQIPGVVLVALNWILVDELYQYTLANSAITANSIVDLIPDNDSIETVQSAGIFPKTESSTGAVTLWSKNAPTGDITVTLNIF